MTRLHYPTIVGKKKKTFLSHDSYLGHGIFYHPLASFLFFSSENSVFLGRGLDPFRVPEPLSILTPSNIVPKEGFQL